MWHGDESYANGGGGGGGGTTTTVCFRSVGRMANCIDRITGGRQLAAAARLACSREVRLNVAHFDACETPSDGRRRRHLGQRGPSKRRALREGIWKGVFRRRRRRRRRRGHKQSTAAATRMMMAMRPFDVHRWSRHSLGRAVSFFHSVAVGSSPFSHFNVQVVVITKAIEFATRSRYSVRSAMVRLLPSVAFLLLNSLVLVCARNTVGSLAFKWQERVLFDEDFSKPLDKGKWMLEHMKIVDEVKTHELNQATTSTHAPNVSTTQSHGTGATTTTTTPTPHFGMVLVPIFDPKRHSHYGSLHRKVHLEAKTRIVVEFKVKAVGYDLSVEHYFDPNVSELKKPFVHVQLVPKLAEDQDTIEIFNFGVHGLNFQPKEWTTITFATNIDEKSAGDYTLQFHTRGEEDPQVRGTFLKEVEMCVQPVPENNKEIRDDYYASTTTVSTTATTLTTPSTTVNPTEEPEPEPTPTHGRIMASRGAEIFVIFLVILLGLGLIALSYRHYKTYNKLREYKVNRSHAGPNFDNPTYAGGDRMGR